MARANPSPPSSSARKRASRQSDPDFVLPSRSKSRQRRKSKPRVERASRLTTIFGGLAQVSLGGVFIPLRGPFQRQRAELALAKLSGLEARDDPRGALGVLFTVFRLLVTRRYEREGAYETGRRFPWSPNVFRKDRLPEGVPDIAVARNWGWFVDQFLSVRIPGTKMRVPLGAGFFGKLPPAFGPAAFLIMSMSIHLSTVWKNNIPLNPIATTPFLRLFLDFLLSAVPGIGTILSMPMQAELVLISAMQHYLLLVVLTEGDERGPDGLWEGVELGEAMGLKGPVRYHDGVRDLLHPGERRKIGDEEKR